MKVTANRRYVGYFFLFGACVTFFVLGVFVFADIAAAASVKTDVLKHLNAGAGKTELGTADPRLVAGGIIQILLSLIGIVFLGLIVAAGYWRLTAQGEEDRVKKSNNTIIGAIVGLFVVMLSYLITDFVVRRVYNASVETDPYEVRESEGTVNQYTIPLVN